VSPPVHHELEVQRRLLRRGGAAPSGSRAGIVGRRARALPPPPGDPDLLPDPIQTGDFGDARTVEERIQVTYHARVKAAWDWLGAHLGAGGQTATDALVLRDAADLRPRRPA
jgi:hypothetical protein